MARGATGWVALAMTAALAIGPAWAYDADRLKLGLGTSRLMTAEGTDVAPHLSMRFSVTGRLEQDPYVLRSPRDVRVGRMAAADLALTLSLWNRMELGVGLPVFLSATGETVDGQRFSGSGVGDTRVMLKVAIARRRAEGAGLALVLPLSLGSGPEDWWLGQEGAVFTPTVAFDVVYAPLRWSATIGYRLRGSAESVDDTDFGQAIVYATGPEVSLGSGVSLLIEAFGEVGTTRYFDDEPSSPLEAIGGIRWDAGAIEVTAAGGGRLRSGAGTPQWRALLSLAYSIRQPASARDDDDDGVPDWNDRCPGVAEDLDGVMDHDGCPEDDGDLDGVRDSFDRCPSDPEDPDGVADSDGCPEEDADGDGISDREDRCPEHMGPAIAKGCPALLADTDEDGINDKDDRCPTEPETFNQTEDEDGCPDTAMTEIRRAGRAEIVEGMIAINGRIRFSGGRFADGSAALVDDVARLLLARVDLVVRIEGHTDDPGPASANKRLSRRWARAVRARLVRRGVAKDRVTVAGFGEAHPIRSNATGEGRAANRRVEIHIVGAAE